MISKIKDKLKQDFINLNRDITIDLKTISRKVDHIANRQLILDSKINTYKEKDIEDLQTRIFTDDIPLNDFLVAQILNSKMEILIFEEEQLHFIMKLTF